MFRSNLPPALLAVRMTRVFYVPSQYISSVGVERTLYKSQHTKLTLEKKILQPLLPGFELTTIPSEVQRSYQQAIQALNSIASLLLYVVVCMGAVVCWLIELHVVSLTSLFNTKYH